MYKTLSFQTIIFTILLVLVKSEDNLTTCDSDDSIQCAQKDLLAFVDNLEAKSTLPVIGDYVSIEKNNNERLEQPRANEDIIERCMRYLATHELRFKLPSHEARSMIEEGRRRKIRKLLLPILLLLKLKAAIVIPIVLSIIALVAFKGLGAGLVAMALSGATAFKSLLENTGQSKISYEIVPPVSPHWSRSGVDYAQPLNPYTQQYQYE